MDIMYLVLIYYYTGPTFYKEFNQFHRDSIPILEYHESARQNMIMSQVLA
jgi:hypothetical protein